MQFSEMTLAVSLLIKFSGPVGKKEDDMVNKWLLQVSPGACTVLFLKAPAYCI